MRKKIEKILTAITFVLFAIVGSINDYDISFMPIYLGIWAIVGINTYLLMKGII